MSERQFDAVVIGTGFGGAVTASRLLQAGLRVCILERGRRYAPNHLDHVPGAAVANVDLSRPESIPSDFPDLPADDRDIPSRARWRWDADREEYGLWDVRVLDGVQVAQAAGYGGGSLVYANVHLRAPPGAFTGWPVGIDAATLKPYYDLVGHMLDIRPVPRAFADGLAKTRAFEVAAENLGARFRPPLAVTFPEDGSLPGADGQPVSPAEMPPVRNRFGRMQRPCTACGACDFGCRVGAKNTLDMNYLALAEAQPGADVRTLADVQFIEPGRDGKGFEVVYADLLEKKTVTVHAPRVFLCAGAVNSTALLLKSVTDNWWQEHSENDRPRAKLPIDAAALQALGEGYFPNADALAMVYDTKPAIEPSRGPVITTALVHEGQGTKDGPAPWFLIEDGGYPATLRATSGLLESPLWLGQNAFGSNHGRGEHPWFERVLFPPRAPSSSGDIRNDNLVEALYYAVLAGQHRPFLPRQLLSDLTAIETQVGMILGREVDQIAELIRSQLVEDKIQQGVALVRKQGLGPGIVAVVEKVLRAVGARIANLLGLNRERVATYTRDLLGRRFHADNRAALVPRFAKWALGEHNIGWPDPDVPPQELLAAERRDAVDPFSHRMLFLAMGRDDHAGKILVDETGRPRVYFDQSLIGRTQAQQERVMQDMASKLGGQLRTSPIWVAGRRLVSSHSQGGCAMGAVTDEWGHVRGCPGLYVNDAALFPQSVGVNPSSTIAALAERNVHHHIQHELPAEAWEGFRPEYEKALAEASAWYAQQVVAGVPLTPPQPTAARVDGQSVQLKFSETMSGFHRAIDFHRAGVQSAARSPDAAPTSLSQLDHRAAEVYGRQHGTRWRFDVDAHIPDIDYFLASPRNRRIDLRGTVTFDLPAAGIAGAVCTISAGELVMIDASETVDAGMRYHIKFAHRGVGYLLEGEKRLKDDPGLDAWLDASCLYSWLKDDAGRVLTHGILRVSMADFLQKQLAGMEAVGGNDPARHAWAIARFGHYFFGQIQKVYLPELDRLKELTRRP